MVITQSFAIQHIILRMHKASRLNFGNYRGSIRVILFLKITYIGTAVTYNDGFSSSIHYLITTIYISIAAKLYILLRVLSILK